VASSWPLHLNRESEEVAGPRELPDRRISLHKIPQLPTVTAAMDRPSKVEQMVLVSERLSIQRGELLATLLAATNPAASGGRAVLRPLWANEAMHRAYSLVTLTHLLDRHCSQCECIPVAKSFEHKNAIALSQAYSAFPLINQSARYW
jgi:hypothetical protein